MMTYKQLQEAKARLAYEEQCLKQQADASNLAEAGALCDKLTKQEWWKRIIKHKNDYHDISIISFYRIRSLKAGWWYNLRGDGELAGGSIKFSGTVESYSLPVTPTLVTSKGISATARGMPPIDMVLRVRPVTKKEMRASPQCWLAYEKNLIAPVDVSAAPILCFSEEAQWFDGLEPSNETEFSLGLRLLLNFVKSVQDNFSLSA